ncbi:MAG: zf-HC2 domain-containing protein [Geminicoccaceae bacterium]|nr:MAG: zf-HC2 domain-containing protein [Geminicoccaceae bacterium]
MSGGDGGWPVDCRQVDRCLEANLDGRLSGFERMALRQHLRTCRTCRAKVEAMRAFSASIERTLAAADGPDWHRLAPPSLPLGLQEMPAQPPLAAAPPVPPKASSRRPFPWRSMAVVSMLAALWFGAQTLWPTTEARSTTSGVTVPLAPTTPALVAEATRRAAARPADFATTDWQLARGWLAERGIVGMPELDRVPDVRLEGVTLEHLLGRRVAALELASPQGTFTLYMLPPHNGTAPALGWAEKGGLMAMAGVWDGWQAILIGSAGQLFPAALSDRLRGVVTAF